MTTASEHSFDPVNKLLLELYREVSYRGWVGGEPGQWSRGMLTSRRIIWRSLERDLVAGVGRQAATLALQWHHIASSFAAQCRSIRMVVDCCKVPGQQNAMASMAGSSRMDRTKKVATR
jgi:hypothetical protein